MPLPIPERSSSVTLFSGATIATANGAAELVDWATAVRFFLDVTLVSGTSPTLDVYIQTLMPDEVTWTDLAHLTQKTATGQEYLDFVMGGNRMSEIQSSALAAGSTNTMLLGHKIRARYVIGGTNPSFTSTLTARFFV